MSDVKTKILMKEWLIEEGYADKECINNNHWSKIIDLCGRFTEHQKSIASKNEAAQGKREFIIEERVSGATYELLCSDTFDTLEKAIAFKEKNFKDYDKEWIRIVEVFE